MLQMISEILNFQIFVVDGSPITPGKLTVSLALVLVGHLLAKSLSSTAGKRVIHQFKVDPPLKYTLERVLYYGLFSILVLFALQVGGIPITIFTLVGGALAIGIGFGSQNVVNNFISGLIVMVAQPVRVSDWIEIEGLFGKIEQIGARSTLLTTVDNKQSIIPNSFFLEKLYTNWTLSDTVVSAVMSVGVDYSANPDKVRQILLGVAQSHPHVLKDPKPNVLLQNFGESSLDFDLIFWVNFGKIEKDGAQAFPKIVASDLRFRVISAFREAGVGIPYPHREVYLHQPKIN